MLPPNDFYLKSLVDHGIRCERVKAIDARPIRDWLDNVDHRSIVELLMPLGSLGEAVLGYALEFYERRPRVVHTWLDHMNVVAGLAALISGVPRIVLSCRSLSPRHFSFHQPYMRQIYCLLGSFPNVVFLNNSEAGARDYAAWLKISPDRIQVIRNGFDFDTFPDPSTCRLLARKYREQNEIKSTDLVVGTVMRLSEEKRPLLWLDIALHVAREVADVIFVVVGDGPMRQCLEDSVTKRGMDKRFRFMGHEHDVSSALAAFNIFLLTSRAEGLPNVLVEAQAMGVPVVTINVGGTGETLSHGKTGWLVDSDDPSIIANTIVSTLRDPAWCAQAAIAGREHALARFGRDRMVVETLRSYGSI